MDLAHRIREERDARGWTLTQLAERSQVSRSMIHKIETGSSSPTAEVLVRIASAFGMTMSLLIARAEAQSGRLLRAPDQPEWQDPHTGYIRAPDFSGGVSSSGTGTCRSACGGRSADACPVL